MQSFKNLKSAGSLRQKKPASSYIPPHRNNLLSPVAEASLSHVPPHVFQRSPNAPAAQSNPTTSSLGSDIWMKVAREQSTRKLPSAPPPKSDLEKMAEYYLAMYEPGLKAKQSLKQPTAKPIVKKCPFTDMTDAPSMRSDDSMVWTESSYDSISFYSDQTTNPSLSPSPSMVRKKSWHQPSRFPEQPEATRSPPALMTPSVVKVASPTPTPEPTPEPTPVPVSPPAWKPKKPSFFNKPRATGPCLSSNDSKVWTESSYDLTANAPIRSDQPTYNDFPSLKARIVGSRFRDCRKTPSIPPAPVTPVNPVPSGSTTSSQLPKLYEGWRVNPKFTRFYNKTMPSSIASDHTSSSLTIDDTNSTLTMGVQTREFIPAHPGSDYRLPVRQGVANQANFDRFFKSRFLEPEPTIPLREGQSMATPLVAAPTPVYSGRWLCGQQRWQTQEEADFEQERRRSLYSADPPPRERERGEAHIHSRPWLPQHGRYQTKLEAQIEQYERCAHLREPRKPITKEDLPIWPSKSDGDVSTLCSDEDWAWYHEDRTQHDAEPQPSEPKPKSVTGSISSIGASVVESIGRVALNLWQSGKNFFGFN